MAKASTNGKAVRPTKSRDEIKQKLLIDPTRTYKSTRFMYYGDMFVHQLPLWRLWTGRMMITSDPIVNFTLNVRNAALMAAEVMITAKNPQVQDWVQKQWNLLWNEHRLKLTGAKRYGYNALQVVYEMKGGLLHIKTLKEFAPEDARALEISGRVVGQSVKGERLFFPQACWLTFDESYGSPYGYAVLRKMYPPWYEKWMDHGAKRLLQLRMIKDAYIGDIFWYPPNMTVELPDGTVMPWRDLFRELGENRLSGGALSLPRLFDDKGKPLTDYTPPQDIGGGSQVYDWVAHCDEGIMQAGDVPMEVVKASQTGSGYSGRSVPFLVVLSVCNQEFVEIVKAIKEQVLRPAAWLNWGGDPEFDIVPLNLVETFADNTAGSAMAGSTIGGGVGSANAPHSLPVANQQFSEELGVTGPNQYNQFIFRKGQKEIGEIQLKKRLTDDNYVTANVLVWPEFQRKGYATKFYQHAHNWVKQQGKKFYLSQDRTEDAKSLHEHFRTKGWLKEDGEIDFDSQHAEEPDPWYEESFQFNEAATRPDPDFSFDSRSDQGFDTLRNKRFYGFHSKFVKGRSAVFHKPMSDQEASVEMKKPPLHYRLNLNPIKESALSVKSKYRQFLMNATKHTGKPVYSFSFMNADPEVSSQGKGYGITNTGHAHEILRHVTKHVRSALSMKDADNSPSFPIVHFESHAPSRSRLYDHLTSKASQHHPYHAYKFRHDGTDHYLLVHHDHAEHVERALADSGHAKAYKKFEGSKKPKQYNLKKRQEYFHDKDNVASQAERFEEEEGWVQYGEESNGFSDEHFTPGRKETKLGKATLLHETNDGTVELHSIRVPKDHRNQGHARTALRSLIAAADQRGLGIKLLASPLDKRTKEGRLVHFYMKHGFKVAGRGNAFGDPLMYREPSSQHKVGNTLIPDELGSRDAGGGSFYSVGSIGQYAEESEEDKEARELAMNEVGEDVKESLDKIQSIKDKQKGLAASAALVTQEIEKLKASFTEHLAGSGYVARLKGMDEVVRQTPSLPVQEPVEVPLFTPLEDVGVTPEQVNYPALEQSVSALLKSPVGAGVDYHHTADLVRAGAFAITTEHSTTTVAHVRDILADSMKQGDSRDQFIDKVTELVEDRFSEPHLETIFRTNTMTQMNQGKLSALKHPLVADHFPYAMYMATLDSRVRPEHRELESLGLDGTNIYRVDDPTFEKFLPPWDYNCRCTFAPQTVEQAANLGVTEAKEWLDRANSLASQMGGTVYDYLDKTAPTEPQHVSPPPFQPPEEFKK